MEAHACRFFGALVQLAGGKRDANRLLNGLENPGRHVWLMSLRRAVDHPDFGTGATQIVTHLLEAGTVEESRHADEADDAFLVLIREACRGVMAGAKHLP